jgi:hypothetical protein
MAITADRALELGDLVRRHRELIKEAESVQAELENSGVSVAPPKASPLIEAVTPDGGLAWQTSVAWYDVVIPFWRGKLYIRAFEPVPLRDGAHPSTERPYWHGFTIYSENNEETFRVHKLTAKSRQELATLAMRKASDESVRLRLRCKATVEGDDRYCFNSPNAGGYCGIHSRGTDASTTRD